MHTKHDQCRRKVIVNIKQESIIPGGEKSIKIVTKELEQWSSAWNRSSRSKYYEKIETTLGKVQPFAIDVKGGGKESNRRKGLLKGKQRKCIAINAKGGDYWKCCHDGKGVGKGGASETVTRKREKQSSREQR